MDGQTLQFLSEFAARRVFSVFTVSRDHFNNLKSLRVSNKPVYINVNTGDSNTPGLHWLVFRVNSNNTCEYFDSYGLDISTYKINCPWPIIKANKQPLQLDYSDSCGKFCLFFIANRSCSHSFDNVMHLFYNDQVKNEKLVSRLHKRLVSLAHGSQCTCCETLKQIKCKIKCKVIENMMA